MRGSRMRIGLTMGDPAGIGPEIILKAVRTLAPRVARGELELTVIGTAALIDNAARRFGYEARVVRERRSDPWPLVSVIESAQSAAEIVPGRLSAEAGRLAYRAIERAVKMAMADEIDAIVTAPISKEALNSAGFRYFGHTDMLADLTGSNDSCMMLAFENLCVTHICTHVPLAEVPKRVTPHRVRRVIEMTLEAIRNLGIATPRVAVCGLNPHSGESGIIGGEESTVIEPVIAEFQARGEDVTGPHPGDTVFVKAVAGQFDAVVAMFHDQGHIPVKLLGFSIDPKSGRWTSLRGVNVTLGLPIIRTSVDHGTAFDIAGNGIANEQSMIEAIEFAVRLGEARVASTGIEKREGVL